MNEELLSKVSGGSKSERIKAYYETLNAFEKSRTEQEAVHLQKVALEMYNRLYHDHLARPGDGIELPPDSYALEEQFLRINGK